MKYKNIIFLAFFALSSAAFSQGFKVEKQNAQRFTDGKDKTIGLIVTDSLTNISWMRCLVGQEYNKETKLCTGEPQKFTILEVKTVIQQIRKSGSAWLPPTASEVMGAQDFLKDALSEEQASARGVYKTCLRKTFWTANATLVNNNPNRYYAECGRYSDGEHVRVEESESESGGAAHSLMLVRRNK